MTVAQFQKIHEINNTTPDTVERLAWIICCVYNRTEVEVDRWNPVKFLRYVRKIDKRLQAKPSKLFRVRLQTEASKITLGQFIECQHWLKNGVIPSMDLVAASLLPKRQRKDHAAAAAKMRAKPFTAIFQQCEQFTESMNKLIRSYQGLFEHEEDTDEDVNKREKEKTHPFIEHYGWLYSAKQLAEYEGLPLDRAYDIPIIQAFNGLSYLKAKQSFDKMKMKQ